MAKLFSIKQEYTDKIYSREKSVELRRQNINARRGDKCLIYTTSPIKKITGLFIVKEKIRLPIMLLWKKTKKIAGISKEKFFEYFRGCKEGTAIFFKQVKKLVHAISLNELRKVKKGFMPPQSYYNLDSEICVFIETKNKGLFKNSQEIALPNFV